MIDPTRVTDYERGEAELQEFFLFSIFVANKNSLRTAKALDFILRQGEGDTPFERIESLIQSGRMLQVLVESRCGEYKRRWKTCAEIAGGWVPNLASATASELERVHGVGMKTSRFFIMHSREGAEVAALDTHILKYLGWITGGLAPKKTPTNPKEYRRWEEEFLFYTNMNGYTPAEFDLKLWRRYSERSAA